VKRAIEGGKSLGLRSVKLTGGEPLLHPQFNELITLINDAELEIVIETNGTLIDDKMAQVFESSSKVKFISVSLDGATPEVHDALRMVGGSFEQAVLGIKRLVEIGFRPQVICTLHQGNIADMDGVVALANQLGCGSVKFNHVQKVGRGEKFIDEHGLSIQDIIQAYNYVKNELAHRSRVPLYFDIPFAFYPIRKFLDGDLGRCSVQNIIGLLAGGEIALCGIGTTIPELVYGNIEKDDLREVWCNHPGMIALREQIPSQLEGICKHCIHRDICQGECVAHNYSIANRLNAPYFFCDQAEKMGLFPLSRKKPHPK
jgi:SynChlorMet cassette radical SAM/SPASM protein ScmF